MAGLVPAIPIIRHCVPKRDCRDKPGNDKLHTANNPPSGAGLARWL
jgi:hypothetical protein